MPKEGWLCSLAPPPVPSSPLTPMTITEGPTGPKTGTPELFMASAASLPTGRSACGIFALNQCPWGPGAQGHLPRGEEELQEQLWEPQGLPYLRQEGQEESLLHRVERLEGPVLPGQADLHPTHTQPGQPGCQGQSRPTRSPSGLPLLCSTHGLSHPWGSQPPQALCCTDSRLVFIPCEDDILFLLSVSVFMCEELLACCACARGELVPGDWTA